jgi:hypothetical protein
VGSVSLVSAFSDTGSPSCVGFSFASSFRDLCPSPFPPDLLGRSLSVGSVDEVSAFRDTGSPSWVGLSLATSFRDFCDGFSYLCFVGRG